jgi:TldD protein
MVLPIEEKLDQMSAWVNLAGRYRGGSATMRATFTRDERAVATTDGAYFTQTLYQSGGRYEFGRRPTTTSTTRGAQNRSGEGIAKGLTKTGAGWEIFLDADLPGQLPALYEAANPNDISKLAKKPGTIGRYDVVFDAVTMGSLLLETIGKATQLDRALGFEANASGTSYLGPDPLAFLGHEQVAAPVVTVVANRSMSRGLGTVKWDDEGVEPDDFVLVQDGVLVDYQTTRDQTHVLAPWYAKHGRPVRSHGCAGADTAWAFPMQHMPNLVLVPGKQDIGFSELVAGISHGLAVMDGSVQTDFQERTGTGSGQIREIVNGKLGSEVQGLGFLFNTTQLWKNVRALGGAQSTLQIPSSESKGQPVQSTSFSIQAVPVQVANVDFIDPARKA